MALCVPIKIIFDGVSKKLFKPVLSFDIKLYPVYPNPCGTSIFVPLVVSVGSVVGSSEKTGSIVGSLEEEALFVGAASVGADSLGTVTLSLGAACCPQETRARMSIERAMMRDNDFFII